MWRVTTCEKLKKSSRNLIDWWLQNIKQKRKTSWSFSVTIFLLVNSVSCPWSSTRGYEDWKEEGNSKPLI